MTNRTTRADLERRLLELARNYRWAWDRATNILLEVSLSFIGIGVPASVPTWGSLLSNAWGTIYTRSPSTPTVWQTLFPTLAILLTVVALNQISEGVRRALDPGGRR